MRVTNTKEIQSESWNVRQSTIEEMKQRVRQYAEANKEKIKLKKMLDIHCDVCDNSSNILCRSQRHMNNIKTNDKKSE
jgi:hypothetical protein